MKKSAVPGRRSSSKAQVPTFERLAAAGRGAILAGAHQVEVPPFDGGRRWGCSAIFRPAAEMGGMFDDLTNPALAIAGDAHWATGSAGAAHMTIRGLEPYRVPIAVDDPAVARYAGALHRATRAQGTIRFDLRGLLVTPISVMLRATPCDEYAAGVWPALDRELRGDGWFEADYQRDIWYVNLIHFAGPIEQPQALIDWVQARSALPVGEITVDRADLVRWEFDGRRMVPTMLAEAPFTD